MVEKAYQELKIRMMGIPDGISEAARYLRRQSDFRGLERNIGLEEQPDFFDARFQDSNFRYYHGKALNDEHAVIIAAARWMKIEVEVPKGVAPQK